MTTRTGGETKSVVLGVTTAGVLAVVGGVVTVGVVGQH